MLFPVFSSLKGCMIYVSLFFQCNTELVSAKASTK